MAYSHPGNKLFPVFLKLEQMSVLVVGAGNVGLEKLNAILNNAPETTITVIGKEISIGIKELAAQCHNIILKEKLYSITDLDGHDIVISALNDATITKQVVLDARSKKIWVNAADKPELCDFYLSSVVQKGHLKIAISTNGQSPTIAKRIKEMLNEVLPDELDELLEQMNSIRNNIKGDFSEKVKQLNELTKTLSTKKS
ncbi:MAG: bifunctional precorrin-2 dehydrogenase/sirohydrochlorin ferrochelatase [Bacteroidetes bacterium]|nr:bifunctional precorrin-2 dehydrogenase/sirohydrochlorin ferrochelatase [Bacteroidota bacterium]